MSDKLQGVEGKYINVYGQETSENQELYQDGIQEYLSDRLLELEKALKNLVKESYNAKYQHGNANMREAMENGESALLKLKGK